MEAVIRHVAILGAGTWGTALAVHLARAGHNARLWGRDSGLINSMRQARRNPVYLSDTVVPEALGITDDLVSAVGEADCVVVAVPSHELRDVVRAAAPALSEGVIVVSATKGLEQGTLSRMSQVIGAECGDRARVAVLSGPSFAQELVLALPVAVTVASADGGVMEAVQQEFRTECCRLYGTDDVVGVEIGGALKNVVAIASGIAEGLGLGESARAALITRGLAEMARLAGAEGGRRETLSGLSGIGDLMLTCTGSFSRNRQVGVELGHGRPLQEILDGMRMVAEGVKTAEAALSLASRHGVEMPITAQVAALLAGRVEARAALGELMLRPQRGEAG